MATNFSSALERLDRLGRTAENTALVVLLGTMIVVAVGQIVLRELFNTGLVWASGVLKLIVLWLTMLAAIAACRDDRHIRVDAISHLLPRGALRVLRTVVDLFAAGVCLMIAWQAYRYLQLEIEFGDTVIIDTPAWMVHAIVPVGFLVTSYRFLISSARSAMGRTQDDEVSVT